MHPALAEARFDKDLAGLSDELLLQRGWTVFTKWYPLLDMGFTSPGGRQLRLRFHCDNFNQDPPSVTLHTWDGGELTQMPPSSTGIFHPGRHPSTGKFFVCMKGTREYHTHYNHLTDSWAAIRDLSRYRLGEIATQIWNGWIKTNQ